MRILNVHNRYLNRGGEDACYEDECALLRAQGNTVIEYVRDNSSILKESAWRAGLRASWSNEDYKILRNLVRTTSPDLISVHNFFPLISPAVYYAAAREGVPVIQTLHNYRLLCSNGLFFRSSATCEECLNKIVPWPAVRYGCYREDRLATGAVTAMIGIHRALSTWEKKVDAFVALTKFGQTKFIQGGVPAEKIMVKPNFILEDPTIGNGSGGYALYIGRLTEEKGIRTLLKAWEKIVRQSSKPTPCLKIVGDGPLASVVRAKCQELSGIQYLGTRSRSEVYDLIGHAAFLLFPSEWYETFGRVAIEAFAKGTPVIASNIGAITELIDHERTGLLFKVGDENSLCSCVEWALTNKTRLNEMRIEARLEYERKYTAEKNYELLMDVYAKAKSNFLMRDV